MEYFAPQQQQAKLRSSQVLSFVVERCPVRLALALGEGWNHLVAVHPVQVALPEELA